MAVDDWMNGFLAEHIVLHRAMILPALDSDDALAVYSAWRSAFVKHGIHEAEVAVEASHRLAALEHTPRQHFPMLLAEARAIYRERALAGQGPRADAREAAEFASRDCPEGCCGQGLTLRWRRKSASDLDDRGRPLVNPITLYCTCPAGRWIKGRLEATAPDARRRMYDLAEHPFLCGANGLKYRHRPEDAPVPTAASDAIKIF